MFKTFESLLSGHASYKKRIIPDIITFIRELSNRSLLATRHGLGDPGLDFISL